MEIWNNVFTVIQALRKAEPNYNSMDVSLEKEGHCETFFLKKKAKLMLQESESNEMLHHRG